MANLIPLHIDKNSGKIIAKGANVPAGGAFGFLYEQIVPATTWNVPHNAENDKLLTQVYDDSGELIIPDKITIIDINTLEIEFTAPMTGNAHIMFFRAV